MYDADDLKLLAADVGELEDDLRAGARFSIRVTVSAGARGKGEPRPWIPRHAAHLSLNGVQIVRALLGNVVDLSERLAAAESELEGHRALSRLQEADPLGDWHFHRLRTSAPGVDLYGVRDGEAEREHRGRTLLEAVLGAEAEFREGARPPGVPALECRGCGGTAFHAAGCPDGPSTDGAPPRDVLLGDGARPLLPPAVRGRARLPGG
jgi:hypothetical protein